VPRRLGWENSIFPLPPSIMNFEILKTELLLNFYVRHNTNKINKQINMVYMFTVPFVSLHSITTACRSMKISETEAPLHIKTKTVLRKIQRGFKRLTTIWRPHTVVHFSFVGDNNWKEACATL